MNNKREHSPTHSSCQSESVKDRIPVQAKGASEYMHATAALKLAVQTKLLAAPCAQTTDVPDHMDTRKTKRQRL